MNTELGLLNIQRMKNMQIGNHSKDQEKGYSVTKIFKKKQQPPVTNACNSIVEPWLLTRGCTLCSRWLVKQWFIGPGARELGSSSTRQCGLWVLNHYSAWQSYDSCWILEGARRKWCWFIEGVETFVSGSVIVLLASSDICGNLISFHWQFNIDQNLERGALPCIVLRPCTFC